MKFTQRTGFAILVAGAVVSGSGAQALAAATSTGPYNIVLHSNGTKCVDVSGDSQTSGAAVDLNTCSSSLNSQKWTGTLVSGSTYQIKNVNSGLCLQASGSSQTNGAALVQSTCSSTSLSQQWIGSMVGSSYQFTNANSNYCLDLAGGATTNGTALEQYSCSTTSASEIWDLAPSEEVASASGTTIPSALKIFDSSFNAWTVSSGVVLENGSDAGYSANVILLLYYKGVIYQENSAKGWWSWTNGTWAAVPGDPRATASPSPSPSPTVKPSPSPTVKPSPSPTVKPSPSPTVKPSPSPTVKPSPSPSPTVKPSPSPTVTITPSPNPSAYKIGVNAPSLSYFNDAAMYSDVTYQMSGNYSRWDTNSGTDAAAPVDSTGAPTVAAWTGFTLDYPSGIYTLTWEGTGSISMAGMGTPVVTTTNGVELHTVPVTLTQSTAAEGWAFVTAVPPVTNIHMMVPASNQISGSVFTKDFIAKMKQFNDVRFMDALFTNGNLTTTWSQRTVPSAGSRSGTIQGMAYEDIVDFANQTGKDIWINIPVRATDDYVCRVARLFLYGESGSDDNGSNCSTTAPSAATSGEVGINSTSTIYLEFSNETWNWAFSQTNDLYCMGNAGVPQPGGSCSISAPTSLIAQAALKDPSLPWAGSSNLWYNGSEMSVLLTKRTGDIFKEVFGSRSSQIKTVQNVQSAYAAEIDPAFQFMKAGFGALTGYIDYMAVAPYAPIDSDSYTATVTDIFSDFANVILQNNPVSGGNSIYQWLLGDLAEANEYGLSLVAYEGGEGLNGYGMDNECNSISGGVGTPSGCNTAMPLESTVETNEFAAQSDPRMYTFYQEYFAVWDKLVGRDHLFNAYTSVGAGVWGSLQNLEDPGSQKWDALLSLTLTPGDANGDGVVNSTDCAIVQANYGKTGMWWSEGDFNHDGVVNAEDLAILNAHITGAQCSAP